ncbi:MAG: class I SAM-dependent methyltransferase [Rhodocyclaceae bacterium]|nr:class I SAM-dependent methyltransferase [Rhodocyclaceae bacterium]
MKPKQDVGFVPALGFHVLTPCYDFVVGVTTRERTFKTALIHQANILPGQVVLDLACGTGTLSIWAKQACQGAEVVGVDGDPAILSIAKRKAQIAGLTIGFDLAMSGALPYEEAYFDRVLSSLFFHHLDMDDKERTASECFRVLRPGGEFHVADWGKPSGLAMRTLFYSIQMLDGFSNTQGNVDGRLPDIFFRAGFQDVAVRKSFDTIFGTMTLYSAKKPEM